MEQQMATGNYKQANRRYHRYLWPTIGLYVVVCFGGPILLSAGWITAPWAPAVIGIATALPIIVMFALMLRLVEETDEYTRLRQLRSIAIGALITLSGAVMIGFLQLFDVVETFWTFWFGPMFFAAYGLAYCVTGRLTSNGVV
ncbi:MAG: hypothetical protein AAGJ32_12585 [Pseudomonadota bacterium]